MNPTMKSLGLTAALTLAAFPALAQEKLKVGLLLTLSGPSAVLGQQARDGFQLAVKEMGGKLGGRDVEVIVVDDGLRRTFVNHKQVQQLVPGEANPMVRIRVWQDVADHGGGVGKIGAAIKVDPFDVAIEEKVALLLAANEAALKVRGSRFVNSSMFFLREEKTYANTEGSYTVQTIYRASPSVSVSRIRVPRASGSAV